MSDELPPTPPPMMSARSKTLLAGMVLANLVGTALFGGVVGLLALLKEFQAKDWLAVPSMFLVPLVVGLFAAWWWRRLQITIGQSFLHAIGVVAISVAGAALVMGEGVVCLVIAAPALYLMVAVGILIGRVWFRVDPTKLQVSILPLLALLTAGEAVYRADEPAVVVDEVLIRARPEQVWPHVLAFPEIPEAPSYWIFRLGLPYPVKTTNGGNHVGADRQCIFSDGIVLKERVAELVPNEKLTFEMTEQPTHPEAYGHITLHRGQFILRDNGDGTTTLIGSSWYTLHVRPLWYFDLWTADMTRAVHLRVMNHVKRLAEKQT